MPLASELHEPIQVSMDEATPFSNEKPHQLEVKDGTTTPSSDSPFKENENEASAPPEYPSGPKLWLTLLALSFVIILGGLDFSIVGVAVPAITEQFHTIADVAWYSVAYRLTACVFQFFWGQIYTIFSVRWALSTAIVIFLLGSAISAAATSSIMFIIGRAITGVGSSGVLGGLFTAIMLVAPLRIRPILTNLLSGLEAVAMVAGPIIGGVLTQKVSWRWCFYINLPIGGATLVCILLFMTDATPSSTGRKDPLTWKQILVKMDLISNLFLIGSLVSLFIVLSWANTKYAWSSATIIGLLVTFGMCLVIFAILQYRRGDEATLPPRVMKQRSVLAAALFGCCLNGASGILEYYIPIYFQVVRGWTPARAGYMMLPMTVGYNIGLLLQGFGTSWMGYYPPYMILSSIVLSVGAGLTTTWNLSTSIGLLIFYGGLLGFGGGVGFECPQIAVQTVLSEDDGPLGLAVTLFAQNFGGAVFIAIAQQIFTVQLLQNLIGKVPNITPATIQNLGFVTLPQGYDNSSSRGILVGYEDAFTHIWYIALALSCITILGSLAIEWRSVKDEVKPETGSA